MPKTPGNWLFDFIDVAQQMISVKLNFPTKKQSIDGQKESSENFEMSYSYAISAMYLTLAVLDQNSAKSTLKTSFCHVYAS